MGMRRREFLGILGCTMVAWPITARSQQTAMTVIGVLDSGSPDGMKANLAALRVGLGEAGFTEGQNLAIEYRWALGKSDQLQALADELVRKPVALIAATRSSAPGLAAKAATATIPIVFQTGSDPVKDGLVSSLNRPGGNLTGVTRLSTALIPKRLELISQLVPKLTSIALLVDPKGQAAEIQMQEMLEPTLRLGLQLHLVKASTEPELDVALASVARNKDGALIVAGGPLFIDRRERIVALAARYAIPTIYFERESVVAGGLMTYAASLNDSFRQVGVYAGRILKGANPADLPVEQPTKFELVINLKTANALGLHVPQSLLATADEVIE
jgi:putative ABC transport system substrate-binding protein